MISLRLALVLTLSTTMWCVEALAASEAPRPPPRPKAEAKEGAAVDRFCEKAVPSVQEFRILTQKKELDALDKKLKERIEALDKLSKSTQELLDRREQQMSKANESVVAIYAKSDPEAAAKQLDEMQDDFAAAILSKLPPQRAGAILGEMNASKASKIVNVMRGDPTNEEKKL